jgi:uncharacterized protein YjbJ (UPF0337 family)
MGEGVRMSACGTKRTFPTGGQSGHAGAASAKKEFVQRLRAIAILSALSLQYDQSGPMSLLLARRSADHRCLASALRSSPPKIENGESLMDWNRVEGNWKQVAGKVKAKWGKLTDDDLTVINGRREQLEGKIQEHYGLAKDQVRKEVDDWFASQGF